MTQLNLYKKSEDAFWYDVETEDESGRKHNVVIEFDDLIDGFKQYAKKICKNKEMFEDNMIEITEEISKEIFNG